MSQYKDYPDIGTPNYKDKMVVRCEALPLLPFPGIVIPIKKIIFIVEILILIKHNARCSQLKSYLCSTFVNHHQLEDGWLSSKRGLNVPFTLIYPIDVFAVTAIISMV